MTTSLQLARVLACTLLLGMFATSSAWADLTTGLIAHYPFDGTTQDVSGNANHGSIVGALAPTTDRFGAPNSAYLFNGINTYVTVPYSVSLSSPTTAITQAAWVYQLGMSLVGSAFNPILMKSSTGENAMMYRLYCLPTGIGVNYGNWNNGHASSTAIALDEWHHIASTYDGQMIRQYLDGLPVDSVGFLYTIVADTRPLWIGADSPGLFEVFNGKLDDVRIYGRALSGAEVAELAGVTLGVGPTGDPHALALSAPRPNPTRGVCTARLSLTAPGDVEVSLVDVSGRLVRTLARGRLEAGQHPILWDGRDASGTEAAAGLYFVHARSNGETRWSRVARVR